MTKIDVYFLGNLTWSSISDEDTKIIGSSTRCQLLGPMNVFVEITRNGCKCLTATFSLCGGEPSLVRRCDGVRRERANEKVYANESHYLATAVTTAQRLMHGHCCCQSSRTIGILRLDVRIHASDDTHSLY